MAELKKTPLNGIHREAGARMIDFGGWDMPVQYSGLTDEHRAVRERAGLFDVSHMGECRLTGKDSERAVNRLVTNDISLMTDGQIMYSPMCNEQGGTVDDLIVYRLDRENFFLVINASNTDKDVAWIREHTKGYDVTVTDESPQWGQLALQGPEAQTILSDLVDFPPGDIGFFTFRTVSVAGIEVILSRSGYTGEDGFELYCPAEKAAALWKALMEAGSGKGILPCGLGARDTLRFEAALPLYGNELGDDISPLEAGLGIFVKLEGEDFIGRAALLKQKDEGLKRKIVGFEMTGKGIPRHGYPVFDGQDKEIGVVTTGYAAPTVGKTVGLALIDAGSAALGTEIRIGIRAKKAEALVCSKRFYSKKYKK
ncbi:MAG: glycine cleavage system aminomethyltransferase GcvT [Spirochaetales bacterium]|nr:glycine cleavage system aminomethyltransferase GcvT [Spirochaetales bacterium]